MYDLVENTSGRVYFTLIPLGWNIRHDLGSPERLLSDAGMVWGFFWAQEDIADFTQRVSAFIELTNQADSLYDFCVEQLLPAGGMSRGFNQTYKKVILKGLFGHPRTGSRLCRA
jgi:hypothetical protein